MPSSGYVADTFVAGEQPTTAKWNELWGNDASFNSGAGFNDNILVTRHFATSGLQLPDKTLNPYKFSAYRSAALSLNSGSNTIIFDATEYDTGSNYSVATGKFTAPIAGFYRFSACITINGGSGAAVIDTISLDKNSGTLYALNATGMPNSLNQAIGGTRELQLAANDTVNVNVNENWGNGLGTTVGIGKTWFQGTLVSAT